MTPEKGIAPNRLKVSLVSLGCDKNLVDSEKILASCKNAGYELVDEPSESDAIIINTCCFIDDAKSESIETILDLAALKDPETGFPKIIAAGCMAKRYYSEIVKKMPEVDAVCESLEPDSVALALKGVLPLPALSTEEKTYGIMRLTSALLPYSYLKIADGCDKGCTYCSIPSIRGRYQSHTIEDLEKEAKRLAECGIKELNLVAQETTLYGKDLYGKKSLHKLLPILCRIEGIEWIRLLYCYPEEIYDELIEVIAKEKKICKYLDIPIQHASDSVLGRMGRNTARSDIVNIINKLRAKIPDIALRTTLITGFPGESESDFLQVCDLLREIQFDHLGVFCYSAQEGTPAKDMAGQISMKLSKRRKNDLMKLQQSIKLSANALMTGKTLPCLIEGYMPKIGAYVTRTYRDAPEVDSYLYLNSDRELMTGDIVSATVTGYDGYDLIGILA